MVGDVRGAWHANRDLSESEVIVETPSIHHVQVAMPADGVNRARAFYRDVLGFREVEKPAVLQSKGGVWFETDNLQVHLGVDKAFIPASKAHVAYLVQDLSVIQQRASDAGYPVVEDDDLPGFERFYTSDPFGNRVEILSESSRRS
jgi:catechol 2,3-dioxygenase-like lactoylglutathione lyase family enzyme